MAAERDMITLPQPTPCCSLLLCAAALLLAAVGPSISVAQSGAAASPGAGKYTGPGSCASTACHGAITPQDINEVLQNEYSVWIVQDKHARAYNALTGAIGERMAGILGVGKAEAAPKCLACHALNPPADLRSRTFDVSEGVSCESCHGPASGWLGPHTERNWTHAQSVAAGMVDVRDIVKRTEKCLSCHLGSEEKFVDHEMIAAGHPDLFFELASFSAAMPRHWKVPGEPGEPTRSDPWYDVRELTTGQAVELRESMLRLAGRTKGKNWPEFSEMQCYACHHSLTPPEQSWRQARGYPGRRPGDPPWNGSRYAVFRDVVQELGGTAAHPLEDQVTQVTALMSALNPDREAVATAAANVSRTADAVVASVEGAAYDPAATRRLLRKICADADEISGEGEQSAAQAAMAIQSLFVAYDRDAKVPNSADIRAAISALFQQLQTPSSYDPRNFSRQMQQVNALLR
ncbi:MAG: multiheme c-type cytochrome [Candidatus Acidiferrales bacterium]